MSIYITLIEKLVEAHFLRSRVNQKITPKNKKGLCKF